MAMLLFNHAESSWFVEFVWLTGFLAFLTGCTMPPSPSNPVVPVAPASHAANLAGSWLLLGSMPSYFVALNSTATNVAASFQISGTTITGSANLQSVCSSGGAFGEGYIGALSGTVKEDGTFTASYSSLGVQTFTIQGSVPTSVGGAWSGAITFSNMGNSSQCVASFSSPFTAASVPSISGTFTGSGQLTFANVVSGLSPALGTTYSMSANLTQEGSGADEALTGTLQIAGFPCFTSGTTSTDLPASTIESNVLNVEYTMNDGASVSLAATVNNTAGTQLAVSGVYVRGDSCAGNYSISTGSVLPISPLLLNQ